MHLVQAVARSEVCPSRLRRWALSVLGLDVGGAWISAGSCFRSVDVSIGALSRVNYGCFFDRGSITIGSRCNVSCGVRFMSMNHETGDVVRRAGRLIETPIRVDDNVWIGAGVTVLGNVHIAEGCVIAAGAVVTSSTEPHGMYAGVPAVRKKDLPQ
jgi:acetyltransferase-like isoleucine patch superfamily enzyme